MGCASLVLAGSALGHSDDPKGRIRSIPFDGPAYRATVDGPLAAGEFQSSGVTLKSWLPLNEFPGGNANANDCWGYTAPSGREYAIIKLQCGTGFVEITDPGNAQLVRFIAGPCSLWGDVKVFRHYAYAVTENQQTGIQVFDMSEIDNGVVTLVNEIEKNQNRGNSHNVAIDTDSGYLYRVGGFYYGTGIYDLNANPVNPPRVGEWSSRYIHDTDVVTYHEGPYAGRQIAFTCGGDNGGFTNTGLEILDVTNKNDIFTVKRFFYSNGTYSHQGWLSADRKYFYLDDELDEGEYGYTTRTRVIDVSDIENPVELPSFTSGNPAIDHNLYVHGSLIFESNYTSGLRVFDISCDPEQPVQVGWFDTYPENDSVQYLGLWSNFPFFPSGTVIGSDRNRALFVWEINVGRTPGDANEDEVVDFGDILAVLATWGPCKGDCPADLDCNGTVDFNDLLLVLSNWS